MPVDARYVASPDGTRIAWTIHGGGPGTPLVAMRPPQFSHLEREWKMGFSHHDFEVHTPARRVLRFDPRGTGLSDRYVANQDVESRLADLEVVIERSGFDQVILDAISASSLPAILYAVRYPDRVERLILQNLFTDGAAWWSSPNRQALLSLATIDWQLCCETLAWLTWPTEDRSGLLALAEHTHACITGDDFVRMAEAEARANVTGLLGCIQAPTLILANPQFARMAPQDFNREAASAIPNASLVFVESARDRATAISTYLTHGLLATAGGVAAPPASNSVVLSARELEVLRLIACGHSNREIADRLVLSARTVDSHAASIYQKTGTRGRADATAFAVRHGLLDDQ